MDPTTEAYITGMIDTMIALTVIGSAIVGFIVCKAINARK